MKKFWKVTLIAVALLVLTATTAFAISINRSPDSTLPMTPEANRASYWGENCTKVDGSVGDGNYGRFSNPHSLIVLKSATWNFVWENTVAGYYGTPTEQDVSHYIYCDGETYSPCDETVPFTGAWSNWKRIDRKITPWFDNGVEWERTITSTFRRTRTVGFTDARDSQHICSSQVEKAFKRTVTTQTRPYSDCYSTVAGDKEYGDWYDVTDVTWNDWVGDNNSRTRTGSKLVARDWSQNFYDVNNSEMVCSVEEGTQQRGQLLREKEDAPCVGMYLFTPTTERDFPCFLNRNPLTDSPWQLPERFDGTNYMYSLCSTVYHCDSITYDETFNWDGEWQFVCDYGQYELDCEGNVCK